MPEVIGVSFKSLGKVYFFDPDGKKVKQGQHVIVETSRGIECGEVMMANTALPDEKITQPLKKLIRFATDMDLRIVRENREFEKKALKICAEKIEKHGLAMKLITAEYTFDHSKLLFYFSADGRVDFRELVKDLASVFRLRIELRQIGVRDEAKMLGGIGICGCPICCSSFLDNFHPVSINMAKDQGLALNPTKISGNCGRLMCCLKYENDVYQELIKTAPEVGSYVSTPQGKGYVTDNAMLKSSSKVRLDNDPDTSASFPFSQIKVLRAPEKSNDEKTENIKEGQ